MSYLSERSAANRAAVKAKGKASTLNTVGRPSTYDEWENTDRELWEDGEDGEAHVAEYHRWLRCMDDGSSPALDEQPASLNPQASMVFPFKA
jgi:hypothetical protein